MTVYRDKTSTISYEVSDYVFEPLSLNSSSSQDDTPRAYEFKNIEKGKLALEKHENLIKKERVAAQKNNFRIAPIVLEHRGLLKQEQEEREQQINDEVERRLHALSEKAFEQGFEQGREEGRGQVFDQMRAEVEARLELVNQMTNSILVQQTDVLERYKKEIYNIVKSLSKWVILRELSEDGQYLERLLEKLVLDINSRTNLLIKVGPSNVEKMDHVFDVVQGKLGQFQNIRLVVDDSLDDLGLVVESENGILNADFNQQLKAIDQLFETLGVSSEGP